MFKTKVTEMLGIKYPIAGGTMMSITTPEFVAAIANAGGLGILASAIYQSEEEFAAAIDKILELTDKPFAVNINLFPAARPVDNNVYTQIMVDKGVKIVETSGRAASDDLIKRFKDGGMTWIHKCVGVKYALKVESTGVDIVTVVGYENGGATGILDIGTLALVPRVVDSVKVPVIGGGGVADARGFLAVLAMGAQGVIMGTRMMATKECPIHDNLKQAFVNATEGDTMLVMRSVGATHRVWANSAAKKCVELEAQNAPLEEIVKATSGLDARKMYESGDLDAGTTSCGQGVGLVHDIPTVKELFDRMISEASEMAKKLAAD